MYKITGKIVWHTTDHYCLSHKQEHKIPEFLLDEKTHNICNQQDAINVAKSILVPFEFNYEAVTVELFAEKVNS